MKLTELEIDNLEIENGKTKKILFDGNGLRLEYKSNNKSWVYRIRRDRKEYNIYLGSYPLVNLKKARELRDILYKYIFKFGIENGTNLFLNKYRIKRKGQSIKKKKLSKTSKKVVSILENLKK